MKKLILLFGIVVSLHATASWEPFGPEGIRANKIRFNVDNNPHWAICHDGGLYLYDLVSQTWTDFPTTLPVVDAWYLDGTKILVIMGDGSYSDGIYAFNPATSAFEILYWAVYPGFIHYDEILQTYYVGYYGGLLTSQDGYTWSEIPTFANRFIVAMDGWQNHLVASEMDNLYGVWYSHDHGVTWSPPTALSPMISDLGFDYEGTLYGIFPDSSYSSGLWSCIDFGETWENEFFSLNMNCVGFDVQGWVLVGWHEYPPLPQEGLAHYLPETGALEYLNEGLPNLFINDICFNPAMSAIALFCCTENGVYISYDYYLGMDEHQMPGGSELRVFPNPVANHASVHYNTQSSDPGTMFRIITLTGDVQMERSINENSGKVDFNCSILPNGVYLIQISGPNKSTTGKFVVAH